ncbi:DUF3185 family protein [Stella sp.]|uniref:DUF3185 family protein n=1 Tax=Stella sp. TaxID=2912054 RepID=UPI0035AD89B0
MQSRSIFGVVLLVVGALLLVFAWRAANAPVDQVVESLTGRFTEGTMLYLIAGIAAVVGGLFLVVARPRA